MVRSTIASYMTKHIFVNVHLYKNGAVYLQRSRIAKIVIIRAWAKLVQCYLLLCALQKLVQRSHIVKIAAICAWAKLVQCYLLLYALQGLVQKVTYCQNCCNLRLYLPYIESGCEGLGAGALDGRLGRVGHFSGS